MPEADLKVVFMLHRASFETAAKCRGVTLSKVHS